MNKKSVLKNYSFFICLITAAVLIGCNSSKKRIDQEDLPKHSQKHTYREMINDTLFVDFLGRSTYDIVFKNDSGFYWKSTVSGSFGDEKTKTIVLDDHRVLTHWIENDSTVVTIHTDFENMTINGFEAFNEQRSIFLIGDLTVKE
ncbi:MAG TPA: hypothetical protein VJ949_09835 [Cryomorphaceae bacterium]|nr:hypothetical protein [Cryomorphaceae bacterium]